MPINGDQNDNVLDGTDDDDEINGFAGNDSLSGLNGDDTLRGGTDNDTLTGGNSGDILNGGAGTDSLSGGAGGDTYIVDNLGDTVFDSGVGFFEGPDEVISSVDFGLSGALENLTLIGGAVFGTGNRQDNVIVGGGIGNALAGQDGDDTLFGGVGGDTLNGGRGGDEVDGGVGADLMSGGSDNDSLFGRGGADTLNGNSGNDRLEGGDGNDVLDGGAGSDAAAYDGASAGVVVDLRIAGNQNTQGAGIDRLSNFEDIIGTVFDDTLRGDDSRNVYLARSGDDRLIGFGGDDVLQADQGNDTLNGGDGDDRLFGQDGADAMTGGAGADIFGYVGENHSGVGIANRDRILDFNRAQGDLIDVERVDADISDAADDAFEVVAALTGAPGELFFKVFAIGTVAQFNLDDDPAADMEIFVGGVTDLTGADFVL